MNPSFEIPEGLTWGWRVVNADFTSANGYRWPWPGNWAECDPQGKPFTTGDPCPSFVGDGLCIAITPAGAASGGIPLHTVLVVGYYEEDVLGRSDEKLRVKRAFVLDAWDAWCRVRVGGSGAYLYGANLYCADLSRAYLYGANLSGANLYGADLSRANLYCADLSGANLYRANLYCADLSGANLSGANLYGANLSCADLSGANLSGANLYGANLSCANADSSTTWPTGFDAASRGVIIR